MSIDGTGEDYRNNVRDLTQGRYTATAPTFFYT